VILLLLGCSLQLAPELKAVRACDAMPGLSLDSAGLAMTKGIIVDDERALWADNIAQGPGFERIGYSGYGVIRANLSCELVSLEGGKAVLERQEPDIDQLPIWEPTSVWDLPTRSVTLNYTVEDTPEGPRVRTGLAQAMQAAEQARALHKAGDAQGAISAWQSLAKTYPDPMIRFEIEEIQRLITLEESDQVLMGPEGETRLSALAGPVTLLVRTPQDCPDCAAMMSTFDAVQADNPSLRIILLAEQPDRIGERARYSMVQSEADPDPLPILTLLNASYTETWRWTGFEATDSLDLQASLNAGIQNALP
jgi:hypothetical protein